MYSQPVNEIYYPIKRSLLKATAENNSATNQLQNLVNDSLLEALNDALSKAERFITLTGKKNSLSQQFNAAKVEIIKEFNTIIAVVIPKNIEIFVRWLRSVKFVVEAEKPVEIKTFVEMIRGHLESILKSHYEIDEQINSRENIKNILFELAKEHIFHISKMLRFHAREHLKGSQEAIEHLSKYKTDYINIVETIKELLKIYPISSNVHTTLIKCIELEANKNECRRVYIEDLIVMMSTKQRQKKILVPAMLAFKEYFSFNIHSLCNEILDNFSYTLNIKLNNVVNYFSRPTLGNNHLFVSNNPYQFYSNLRLSNRSQKRQTKNLANSLFTGNKVARAWRLTDKLTDSSDVIETQEILSTSLGRKDMVDSLGSYAKVSDIITHISNYFESINAEVTHANIAEWIRTIFNGSIPDLVLPKNNHSLILHKLQSVTYLLLGCEATRNPAMHVVNQMLLDLILEDKEWNFTQAFTGKDSSKVAIKYTMPMVPEGAVATARALESNHRKRMPYPYYYRGVEDKEGKDTKFKIDDLILLEAKIMRDWLKLKAPSLARIKNNLTYKILEVIESHYPKWITALPSKKKNSDEDDLSLKMTSMNLK